MPLWNRNCSSNTFTKRVTYFPDDNRHHRISSLFHRATTVPPRPWQLKKRKSASPLLTIPSCNLEPVTSTFAGAHVDDTTISSTSSLFPVSSENLIGSSSSAGLASLLRTSTSRTTQQQQKKRTEIDLISAATTKGDKEGELAHLAIERSLLRG